MNIDFCYLKLSAQRALLGNVSANLRAVCVDYEKNEIKVIFYYDNTISEENQELFEHCIDQIISDFPRSTDDGEINFITEIMNINYPNKMPLIGQWVYYRHEE